MQIRTFEWNIRRAIAIALVPLLAGIPIAAYQARSIQLTNITPGMIGGVVKLDMKHVSSLQITVMATDEQGRPLRRAAIIFILPLTGASAYFLGRAQTFTTLTGDDGRASARIEGPNNIPGDFEIIIRGSFEDLPPAALSISVNNFRPGLPAGQIATIGTLVAGGFFTLWLLTRDEPPKPTIITLGPAVVR